MIFEIQRQERERDRKRANQKQHTMQGNDDTNLEGIPNDVDDDPADGVQPNEVSAATTPNDKKHTSHIFNKDVHPFHVRWGILLFLIGTLVLLLFADFGSGVTADSILVEQTMDDAGVYTNTTVSSTPILSVSVVSSVGKLWEAQSYPLAIFIAITSIGWPYLKLLLATVAWTTPYSNVRRRELLIETIDALGKWSFVDIMVLVEIMVAFRSTIVMVPDQLFLEIVIVAQWGFYGFVVATMLSLASTHMILHYHRKAHGHHQNENIAAADEAKANEESMEAGETTTRDPETTTSLTKFGNFSTTQQFLVVVALILSMTLFVAGVLVDCFEVTSTRGEMSTTQSYSISSIGMEIPDAYIDSSHTGTRFIQFLWFFLGLATPLLCSVFFLILYTAPILAKHGMKVGMEVIFTLGEITFAWRYAFCFVWCNSFLIEV